MKTPLFEYHKEHSKLTEFAGYEMPLWYKGIIEEHLATRNRAGLFDVSHMGRIRVYGEGADQFLDHILPSNVKPVKAGRCVYTLLLNEMGGIIDDLIFLKNTEDDFLLVVNAANRTKDLEWIQKQASKYSVKIVDITLETALLAIQGPAAEKILQRSVNYDLKTFGRFAHARMQVAGVNTMVSRTGYTGEDGFEVVVQEASEAVNVWSSLLAAGEPQGLLPCGLGARDTLRLEAGLCLYGQDLNETINPFEAKLSWVVNLDKSDFLGRAVLLEAKQQVSKVRVGFKTVDAGIPRPGYFLMMAGEGVGYVTSGTYSPLLSKGIGMGYVDPMSAGEGTKIIFTVRGVDREAVVAGLPFYDKKLYGYARVTT